MLQQVWSLSHFILLTFDNFYDEARLRALEGHRVKKPFQGSETERNEALLVGPNKSNTEYFSGEEVIV